MTDGIAITGLGIASPIGCTERAFWRSLKEGHSGALPVTGFDTSDLPRTIACQVREPIDADPGVGRAAALAIHAARQAAADAAVDGAARVSILIGTTMGETGFIEERLDAPADQWLDAAHVRRIHAGGPGSLARRVRRALGLRGPAVDLYGACAAGNMALAAACGALSDGTCDIALAGGADGFSRLAFLGFMRSRVMAAEVCRPFDETRDGLLVGEGAAVFVLEREPDALARGARVRARLRGYAMTCESYHPTRPDPDGDGLSRATRDALARADLTPDDIDYVCAHGTGTPHNDAIEVKVMQSHFPRGAPFSSLKSLTGHTMGAAAAIEAAACVLSLEHQTLIPSWNLVKPMPTAPLDPIAGAPRPARLRHVLNNSAGFGGYNCSVVLSSV
jgi:3-oxoacyl-[acyl-carrier-protein] synthase II